MEEGKEGRKTGDSYGPPLLFLWILSLELKIYGIFLQVKVLFPFLSH